MTWPSVRLACIKELGYALMYMDYIHPDTDWGPQKSRVLVLCEELGRDFTGRCDVAIYYWDDFKRRIADEIENMC